jgi:hypothetical protein
MTFRPRILSRGTFAAVLVVVACLAGPVAGANAQAAPETTIVSGPSGPTNNATPTFTFSSSDPMATFECRHYAAEPAPAFGSCMFPLGPLAEGAWIFEVRAVDAGNVPDPTPARADFIIDLTNPETTITSGPTGPTSASPEFSFSSEPGAAFQCWLHRPGATPPGFTPCSSPAMYSALPEGDWVFEVTALDLAGNPEAEPATRSFTVDATAPNTTIASGPAALSNDSTPEFAFNSTEPGGFACQLHRVGGPSTPLAACGPTYAPGPLGDGAYVVEVIAIDTAGNVDASPASWPFEIDTTPPQTAITGGPGDTTAATAVFLFSAPGAARFSCRLDGGAWQPCDSPHTYPTLSLGGHRFEVTAVDAAGNEDPTPAEHAWQVLKPGLVIPAAVKQATALAKELIQMRKALARIRLRTLARRRTLTFNTFNALTAGTVGVRARTRVRRGGARRWITVIAGRRKVPGAGRRPVRTRVTKKGRSLARSRRRLPLELRLSFTDLAGRSLWATSKVTLRR